MTHYSTTTLEPIRVRDGYFYDGRWWDTREGAPDRDVHLRNVGIVALADTPHPADTDTHTHDRTVVLDAGVPTVVWTQREWTEDEVFAREAAVTPDPLIVLKERLVPTETWTADGRYLPGEIVLDANGKRWRNDLGVVNVWPLDNRHARWTLLDVTETEGPQPWQPWSGFNEDLHQIGDRVTHDGQTWQSTAANNHWTPGVFGWTVVPAA